MDKTDKLEFESAKGDRYQDAWNEMVQPFFEAKQRELYEAFLNHPTSDDKGLVTLKLQANALNSLKDEFLTHINTGNLAKKELEGENDGN